MTETTATTLRATDVAFRAAQDESVTTGRRIANAVAFEVLTLEEVAASMDVDAATLKARRVELVSKGAATLSIVEELTQREAERAILNAVAAAEQVVADREARLARQARRDAIVATGHRVCVRCDGSGSFARGTCYRCGGDGIDPR